MFLSLLPIKKFPSRELLILDEAHLLETEIVGFTGISISKSRWKRHIPNFRMVDNAAVTPANFTTPSYCNTIARLF